MGNAASSAPGRAGRRAPRWLPCLLLALLGTQAAASCRSGTGPQSAQEIVRSATERMLGAVARERETLAADPERIRALVDEHVTPHVDIDAFSRLVLGKHWAGATAEQRRRFVAEFRDLMLRTYASALPELIDIHVDYLPPRPEPRDDLATVRTRIPRPAGPPVSIDYRLHCDGSGEWKLFDVRVEGVSMVATFRSAFSAEVAKSGIDGLIESLAQKNREKKGSSAQSHDLLGARGVDGDRVVEVRLGGAHAHGHREAL